MNQQEHGFAHRLDNSQPVPVCGEHHQAKEWRLTTFEYTDQGVSVRIPNVYAWVCPTDGEAAFTPETTDELILMVREFITAAQV